MEYMDLVYFGYDYAPEAIENRKFESDFKQQINERFPNSVLRDAYDNIKGFRQEVYFKLKEGETKEGMRDLYRAWLIGKGWYEMSLTMQLMMMSAEKKNEALRILDLAKKEYPEAFKPEAL
jgi:hypothetical protein